jgi:glycosyltransferase involved in cell wall biosynthesis
VVRDGEFGFLVAPGDVSGFAGKISELFDDAALAERFSQKACRAARAGDYAWPRQVERTAQLLQALM